MNIKLYSSENPISINDIREIEKLYKVKFPSFYVQLLLKYNGGIMEGTNRYYNYGEVENFIPLKYGSYDIEKRMIDHIEDLDCALTETMVPIINYNGGGIYMEMNPTKIDYGHVYLWYSSSADEIEHLENSLEDFLNSLSDKTY